MNHGRDHGEDDGDGDNYERGKKLDLGGHEENSGDGKRDAQIEGHEKK